ncbi:MAG TPA: glycoside hydrolase family 43 protein [Blastocatellia bacterium]|nr:glycoside hydrolase family 43 protein [Blastocatellia bacterium]
MISGNSVYLNPVHARACPDPFVIKYLNEYWCYCTGVWHDNRCFGVLHSRDLVEWHSLGGALERWAPEATCWWAPEVWYEEGTFRMYYSVGNETRMQIRVAEAQHPAGPFKDCGVRLTREEFAIDAHVFEDLDGTRWLFYATDFLTHTHLGTGTVCDRMNGPLALAGNPRPVTRARYDWQIYDPARAEKGGVCWHTVEGPFVLQRKGCYYQMFSGGNWKNETYGVSYALSDRVDRPDEWEQLADGVRVKPVLRSIPGEVIGPGHNSVVRGPNNREQYCVYHRWSEAINDRVLAIDRLDWAGERMLINGPSFTPQPAPLESTFSDPFSQATKTGLGEAWVCLSGSWKVEDGRARQLRPEGEAMAMCRMGGPYFTAEVSLQVADERKSGGAAGIMLMRRSRPVLFFTLVPEQKMARVKAQIAGTWKRQAVALPFRFDSAAFYLLRVEVNGLRVAVEVAGAAHRWEGVLSHQPDSVGLVTQDSEASFAGFALTEGWEDLFTGEGVNPASWGWRMQPDDGWYLNEGQLWYTNTAGQGSILTKGPLPKAYELVINAKLMSEPAPQEGYGFLPALGADSGWLFRVVNLGSGWALCYGEQKNPQSFPLPSSFDPFEYQQFRFRRQGKRLLIQHEWQPIAEIEVPAAARADQVIGLYANRAVVAFEMIRVTALASNEVK